MARTTIDYGIDLGTTNSSVAVFDGTVAQVIRNNNNSDYRQIRMSRTSQAGVLENVVAFETRYHIS